MASNATIVFGATGHVASVVARTAQAQGAKVFLATRDLEKAIPGISTENEQSGGFERVYADVTKPETVTAAVQKTGAKRAFIYLLFRQDMKPSVEALKAAGVEFVVFLSSSSVTGDIRSIGQDNFIAWQHAQVEIALSDTFGPDNYVAVRPGYFATNTLSWKAMIKTNQVKIVYPGVYFDYVSHSDIGRVCGSLLAKGPQVFETQAGHNVVRVGGPAVLTQRDAALTVGKVLGKELEIIDLDDQAGTDFYTQVMKLPEVQAKGLVGMLKARSGGTISSAGYVGPIYEESVANVERFSGQPATPYAQWVAENKEDFES
ncbi:hypothetical protein BX600DRAFT_477189 [Xylariales sp. PMI_506]|nr:hypothetical protein BX600DRAFT_477189 [Xylariales sp. PMI_506]